MIRFTVFGPIVAQGRPRLTTVNGYVRAFDPAKSRTHKQRVRSVAMAAMTGKKPLTGAVSVTMRFYFQPPTSWSKEKISAALCGDLKPCVKPDIDNVVKAILDGINTICFDDDKQVTALWAAKLYGHPERVEVEIGEV